MKLYKTEDGPVIEERGDFYQLADTDWDVLINRHDHELVLTSMTRRSKPLPNFSPETDALAPILDAYSNLEKFIDKTAARVSLEASEARTVRVETPNLLAT